jgi:hypothetical protein
MSRNWKIPLEGDPELTTLLTHAQATRENRTLQSGFASGWSQDAGGATDLNATTAPDGTLTAARLKDDNAGGFATIDKYRGHSFDLSTAYVWSAYLKADQLKWGYLGVPTLGSLVIRAWFDLENGVVGTTTVDNDDQGMTYVGNGWYRCWIAFTSDAVDTSGSPLIACAETDNAISNTARDGTSSIFMWGPQVEAGTEMTPYIPTTTAARTITGFTPINSLVDDMHTAMETVLEVEGNINDLWKRYKQLN